MSDHHLRSGLLDFQVGECHDNIPFKPEEYIRASADAGIKEIVLTCKDAYGNAYYDSTLIRRNSAIQDDYLLEATQAGPLTWMVPKTEPAAPAKPTLDTISEAESSAAQARLALVGYAIDPLLLRRFRGARNLAQHPPPSTHYGPGHPSGN